MSKSKNKRKRKFPKITLEGNRPMLLVMKELLIPKRFTIEPSWKMVYGNTMEVYAVNETPNPVWWRHRIEEEDIAFTKKHYEFVGYL